MNRPEEKWSPAAHRVTYVVQVEVPKAMITVMTRFGPMVRHVHTIDVMWQWRSGEDVLAKPYLVALRTGNPRTANLDGGTVHLSQLTAVPAWLNSIIKRSRPQSS